MAVRDKSKSSDLLKAFRENRRQCCVVDNPVKSVENHTTFSRGYTGKKSTSDPYSSFMEKYNHLESTIDSFNARDLMYYFREKARESGTKYVIANMKRDMGIFKKLLSNYEPKEVCLMIEFIFFSEQDYLDKTITQPTVLASSWCNTIYRDALLWANDEYVPSLKPAKKSRVTREWGRESTEEKAVIGEWDDE